MTAAADHLELWQALRPGCRSFARHALCTRVAADGSVGLANSPPLPRTKRPALPGCVTDDLARDPGVREGDLRARLRVPVSADGRGRGAITEAGKPGRQLGKRRVNVGSLPPTAATDDHSARIQVVPGAYRGIPLVAMLPAGARAAGSLDVHARITPAHDDGRQRRILIGDYNRGVGGLAQPRLARANPVGNVLDPV
jgi:hypothetical protein